MLRSRIPAAARAALQARRVAGAPLIAAPRAAAPAPLRLPAHARSVQTSAVGTKLVKDNGDTLVIAHQKEHFDAYRCDPPALEQEVSKAELVEIYRDAVQMRRMEMACDQLYKAKMIRGFCHLAIGQEAVSVGMHHAIKKDDKIITAYRCHPFAALRGGTIKGVIAELLGREAGMSKGKGGSMHIFTPTFFGGNGIVGAQVPLGAGIAFAQQYLGQDNEHATFAMYGDGASNQGQVFEAYNMAKLWNLPCVFVCENNLYGMGTSAARSSSNTKYFQRGDLIPGVQVNAMDVLSVMQAVKYAKEWTTSGKGPLLLEMVTYRYGGHSMSDPGTTYRTREEIQHMRSSNDPITGLKNLLLEWGVVEEAELKKIDKEARAVVEKAVEEAKASPEPAQDREMWTDVYYAGTNPMFLRGREREEVHHFAKNDSDLYEGGAPQFGTAGTKMESLTSTV
ncbi:hypothetical protein Rhopal_007680-T1 [Rhodotorula paludigena]|uniref:Pyruvate dehydrogenase E1 component subunit alpha n=2 Tax=Opisthokonta TaxID=33154 RepID=A0AAV5H034_9BASI|nr:hypothetical protein Rhopal_007680-T1 [Rhodotorula paludigena]